MKNIYTALCLLISVVFCEENFDYHLHLYSINRLSDGGVIKIPFRLADIDFTHQGNDLDVISRISFEYKPKFSDFYFFSQE